LFRADDGARNPRNPHNKECTMNRKQPPDVNVALDAGLNLSLESAGACITAKLSPDKALGLAMLLIHHARDAFYKQTKDIERLTGAAQ
jgi:hypothetical protein